MYILFDVHQDLSVKHFVIPNPESRSLNTRVLGALIQTPLQGLQKLEGHSRILFFPAIVEPSNKFPSLSPLLIHIHVYVYKLTVLAIFSLTLPCLFSMIKKIERNCDRRRIVWLKKHWFDLQTKRLLFFLFRRNHWFKYICICFGISSYIISCLNSSSNKIRVLILGLLLNCS